MLQIKNISKQYRTGDLVQQALDDVSLNFRDNEFVAILGPSGSGKTTLLNIIGGLDRYDSGDLVIDSVSTRKYKDRDWDSYRNHTVGFVFQSYNLIPHQTVLQNVELALTIGGISSRERERMSLEALEKVGLREQAHKKPNQMSGGQMQRVAIARALVNNPKILLADEPTGALDTKTSIQVMDLLKEVAKDRLVVMVTHNPELAEMYANRTVRLQDGVILSDTNPLIVDSRLPAVHKNLGKASMSLLTSLGLSLNNLMTKKARTFLTAFAGSIGIIGIAMILSLSTGFQNYIDQIQEETMVSYPLTITSETTDMFSAILTMRAEPEGEIGDRDLVEKQFISSIMGSVTSNDLKTFKYYLDTHVDEYEEDVKFIKYTYSVEPLIYTIDSADNLAQINPSRATAATMGGMSASAMSRFTGGGSMNSVFSEMTSLDRVQDNYQLITGQWPENYNEMLLVLSDPHQISDLLLYSLGFRDTKELRGIITDIMAGEKVETENDAMIITYDDLLNLELKLINPSSKYVYNSKYDIYEDMSDDEEYMMNVYENAETLRIVGIACTNTEGGSSLNAGILYMPELTKYVIRTAEASEIVAKQMSNKDIDVFSGNEFSEDKNETGLDFGDMISVDEDMIADAFKINMPAGGLFNAEQMQDIVMGSSNRVSNNIRSVANGMKNGLTRLDSNIAAGMIQAYVEAASAAADAALGEPAGPGSSDTLPEDDDDDDNDNDGDDGDDDDTPARPAEKKYLLIETVGRGTTLDGLKASGLIDQIVEEAVSALEEQMQGVTVSRDNVKKVIEDALNIFIDSLSKETITKKISMFGQEMEVQFVVSENDPAVIAGLMSRAVAESMANNRQIINDERLDIAQKLTPLLVARGMAEALGKVLEPLEDMFSGDIMTVDTEKFASAFSFDLNEDELTRLMSAMLSGSTASYTNNLLGLGYQDIADPTSISFYFKDFESKGRFMDFLKDYNEKADEEQELRYTDLTGLLMGSVETIISSVTYVLIAFVSISLIVSSIMIGIITYISVLERTKEIGILRAIGASKRNVSSIFNAETFIIGLLSGLIGVATTYILNFPVNHVIHSVTGNPDIVAVLPGVAAVALVIIATVLTMIGGLIPSNSASKKDPVIALRSE